jgi:stage II sporulation protein AA (anti-sigma F factor antagonist)
VAASSMVVSQFQGVTVVSFRGASIVDAMVVQAIGEQLSDIIDQQAAKRLILDFDVVRMMSSQMLGVLISLQKKAKEIKGRVVLCAVRPEVMKIFDIMKLTKMFEFAPSEAEGFRKLGF